MLLWYWQESVQKNAMKPSLGDCDTQTLGIQPGGINWWTIQTEKWTASFIFAYTREDCWDIQIERLVLDSVFNAFSYILKTWMLFVLAYTRPRVINCDVLWFHAKALETLLYVYIYNIMEVGHKWEQGTACVNMTGLNRERFRSLGLWKCPVLKK